MSDEAVSVEVFLPADGTGPGVLVLQEIFGVGDYIRARCRDLADAGYVVHAPALYDRLPTTPVFDEAADDYILQGVNASMELPWETALADASAALDALRAAPEVTGPVGVVGFCYGGGLAYNLAAINPPDVLVCYYGSALPGLIDAIPWVDVPTLHHFGTDDAYIPMDQVNRIAESVSQSDSGVVFELHPGAGHAFDNPHPLLHHAEASERAWQITLDYLHRHVSD